MFHESSRFSFISYDWIFNLIGNWNVGINVVDEPAKRLTLQTLSKLNLLGNVTKITFRVTDRSVIIFLVIVQPNLS